MPNSLLRKYQDGRAAAPEGALILFRMGDFYEAFYDHARTIAAALDLHLTTRDSPDGKVPMCGVPIYTIDRYVAALTALGYPVAVVGQASDTMAQSIAAQIEAGGMGRND